MNEHNGVLVSRMKIVEVANAIKDGVLSIVTAGHDIDWSFI